jgi:hypothetical protein
MCDNNKSMPHAVSSNVDIKGLESKAPLHMPGHNKGNVIAVGLAARFGGGIRRTCSVIVDRARDMIVRERFQGSGRTGYTPPFGYERR